MAMSSLTRSALVGKLLIISAVVAFPLPAFSQGSDDFTIATWRYYCASALEYPNSDACVAALSGRAAATPSTQTQSYVVAEPSAPRADQETTDVVDSAPAQTSDEPTRGFLPGRLGYLNSDFSIKNGWTIASEKTDFVMHVGGRLFFDAAEFFEDKNEDLGDSFDIRDARVEIEATLSHDWSFRLSSGVTTGEDGSGGIQFDLKDMYARYTGFSPLELTIGQHDEPFSLEEMTSGRRITFMERSLANALAPGTNLGLSARSHGEWWTAAGGLFFDDIASTKDQGTQGRGFTGRLTATPVLDGSVLLHLGGSLSLRKTEDSEGVIFRTRPESGIADVRYVNTGPIKGADDIYRLGLEAAFIQGPYSLQAEYIMTKIERDGGFSNAWFDSWYVYASWLVTGETRPYISEIGNFGQITPNHKLGAVELALRYSSIDLSSKDVLGGKEQNLTLGLNWYAHPQVRLMVNYIFVWADDDANDDGAVLGGDNPQILQARLQVYF